MLNIHTFKKVWFPIKLGRTVKVHATCAAYSIYYTGHSSLLQVQVNPYSCWYFEICMEPLISSVSALSSVYDICEFPPYWEIPVTVAAWLYTHQNVTWWHLFLWIPDWVSQPHLHSYVIYFHWKLRFGFFKWYALPPAMYSLTGENICFPIGGWRDILDSISSGD